MSTGEDVRVDAAMAAASLRLMLASVDAGEIEAEPDQRAYLLGAADALDALARPSSNAVSKPSL